MKARSILVVAFSNLYFILAGLLLIPYAGFQHDEVVFAEPIYSHGIAFYSKELSEGSWLPLMINSYAGALKTWIYWPILAVWNPSAYSIRVPALLIAALSIVMFWPIMVRAGGRRAAAIATVLLATDSMYLMTSIFDWGPCALQHLFLVAVMLTFIRFHETASPFLLFLASLLSGLALWEKALFFWLAGGLVVGCLAIYPRQVFRHFSWRNLGLAVAGFVIGAYPFILYNIHKPNATLGENATFSTDEFAGKVESARRTINAHAIYGYVVFDDWVEPPRQPRTGLERASMALRSATGMSQKNEMMWAYGLAILLIPFTWRTRAWRPLLFALVFCAVGWGLMLITKNAGASVHHVILLWPIPLMFLSLTFSEASRRVPPKIGVPVLCLLVAYFAAENILSTNQYLAQFIRNGPEYNWTNALYTMSDDLMRSHYTEIDGIDWGTNVPLEVLDHGQLPVAFLPVDENYPQEALFRMKKPGLVFLGHVNVKGIVVYPDVNDKLDAIAKKNGFVKQTIKIYPDGNGRPVFELFQYHPATGESSPEKAAK